MVSIIERERYHRTVIAHVPAEVTGQWEDFLKCVDLTGKELIVRPMDVEPIREERFNHFKTEYLKHQQRIEEQALPSHQNFYKVYRGRESTKQQPIKMYELKRL